MDQMEANLAKMTEQLQTLTAAMSNVAVPRAGGSSENERREEPPNKVNEDIHMFDDDMAEYTVWRIAGSQAEIQKHHDQIESVTR